MEFVHISTTFGDESMARQLAAGLVESRLVACAQLEGPITSVYRWQGNVENETEWRLVMKTRRDLFVQVASAITKSHSYDVPQIVATPIVEISDSYAAWMREQLIDVGELTGDSKEDL